jgi:hypothetical protein
MEPGQFPGPLYPPGAAPGHTPSKDSDFVIAVKRACAHLGAWPWDPPSWDDAYSDRFAYGVPGDAARAGLRAVQRWAGTLDPTGFVGERTFNFLRSVLIPQGRTHAGEPAWDAVCVNLTAAAYELTVPPALSKPLRSEALYCAIDEIGKRESPAGSNLQEYGAWYGENGVPWCAIFVSWCYVRAAGALDVACSTFQTVLEAGANDRYDYVPYIVADARGGRYGLSVTSSPIAGDLVCFDWNRNGEYDHVGLFEEWQSGRNFSSIEGNTSTSDDSNGGQVMRRSRNVDAQGTVFVRVVDAW